MEKSFTTARPPTALAERRLARQGDALRQNLKRRKDQARARDAGTEGAAVSTCIEPDRPKG